MLAFRTPNLGAGPYGKWREMMVSWAGGFCWFETRFPVWLPHVFHGSCGDSSLSQVDDLWFPDMGKYWKRFREDLIAGLAGFWGLFQRILVLAQSCLTMSLCRSPKTPLAQHAAHLRGTSQAEAAMPFPMFTVPVEDTLQMSAVEPHEHLMAQGLLVKFETNLGKAVFVSHQWAEKDHPDPAFERFKVFQDVIRNILFDGLNHIPLDHITEAVVPGAKPLSTQKFRSHKLFIWYDYFSCPQLEESNSPESNLANAIASIHAYVTKCSFFFALCPYSEDPVTFGVLGPSSWGSRGWCRLERTMRELSEGSWILIKSAKRLELVVGSRAINGPVGEGDFAVASDKVKLGPVLEATLKGKMKSSLCRNDFVSYRIVRNLQNVYLRGLQGQLELDVVPGFIFSADNPASLVSHFLYQNGFWSIHEVDSAGFMPLHYAVLSGDVQLIKAMLRQRADPTRITRKGQPLLGLPPWVSTLGLGLMCGHNDVAKLLLEARAKAYQRNVVVSALHLAAYANNVEGIRLLLASGCDPESPNIFGIPAAMTACDANSLAALEELLKGGASISRLLNASAQSSLGGSAKVTRRLIELRANIDEQWQVQWRTLTGLIVAVQSLSYQLGKDTASTQQFYHAHGSTPLMQALLIGNYEIAMLLLREGARLDLRNARKFAAADLSGGAPETLNEILQGDSVFCRV